MEDSTIKEEWKITSINVPVKLHKKLKEIAIREDKDLGDIFKELMEGYVKIHGGDGNPQPKLDPFMEQDNFKAMSFFKDYQGWAKYYSTVRSLAEYKEIDRQLNMIIVIHNKELSKWR